MLLIRVSQVRKHFPVVPGELPTNPFLIYDSWGTSAGKGILIDMNSNKALMFLTQNPTRDLPGCVKILHLLYKCPFPNTSL